MRDETLGGVTVPQQIIRGDAQLGGQPLFLRFHLAVSFGIPPGNRKSRREFDSLRECRAESRPGFENVDLATDPLLHAPAFAATTPTKVGDKAIGKTSTMWWSRR